MIYILTAHNTVIIRYTRSRANGNSLPVLIYTGAIDAAVAKFNAKGNHLRKKNSQYWVKVDCPAIPMLMAV